MKESEKNLFERGLDNLQHPFSSFVRAQTTSSLFLLIATIAALWWANSESFVSYFNLVFTPIRMIFGEFELQTSVKHIMNDGLMVIFFFLLGLEIKREILAGDLALSENRRMLVLCAVGGMVCPAVIYSLFNWSLASQIGWGIPMATDTAFALGVLTLVKKHIPTSLLAFIVGLAIVDDVGAILVIAIFYTEQISITYLLGAVALIAFLAAGNYASIRQPMFYLIFGIAAWWLTLKSGIHPTFAGVAIAMTIPARPQAASGKILHKAKKIIGKMLKKTKVVDVLGNRHDHELVQEVRDIAERAGTPLRRWEDLLSLPVALIILPLFALINAGIHFDLSTVVSDITSPTGLGIITGLLLGKFIGISGTCWLALRYNIGLLPKGVTLQHVIGASLIAGMGFTMSTFIATLGFDAQQENLHIAKTAIMVASVLAAVFAVVYFRVIAKAQKPVIQEKVINHHPGI